MLAIPSSKKGDKEINEMVTSAVKKSRRRKATIPVDTALLMRSKEFKEVEKHLQNEESEETSSTRRRAEQGRHF